MRLSHFLRQMTEEEWLRTSSWAWAVPASKELPESEDRQRNIIVNGVLRPLGKRKYPWMVLVKAKGASA